MESQPTGSKMTEERERLHRVIRFSLAMSAFWLLLLFLLYEHDNKLLIALLCLLGLFILVIIVAVCRILLTPSRSVQQMSKTGQCEMTEHDEQQSTLIIRNDSDDSTQLFACRFQQTAQHIRNCKELLRPNYHPKNGDYKVVYTAIVFGKQIRSEGALCLVFTPKSKDPLDNTGWEIDGTCNFGGVSTRIVHGFVNAMGQIYWVVPLSSSVSKERRNCDSKHLHETRPLSDVTVYRGIWNLENNIWEGGEFLSIQNSSVTSSGEAARHEGRIVRFEFQGDAADMICTVPSRDTDLV